MGERGGSCKGGHGYTCTVGEWKKKKDKVGYARWQDITAVKRGREF
jgi:hypothetical protein